VLVVEHETAVMDGHVGMALRVRERVEPDVRDPRIPRTQERFAKRVRRVIAVVAPETMRRGDVICVADLDASGAPLWEVEQSATCPRATGEKWRRRRRPPRRAGAGARPHLDRIASKVDRLSRTRDGSSRIIRWDHPVRTRDGSSGTDRGCAHPDGSSGTDHPGLRAPGTDHPLDHPLGSGRIILILLDHPLATCPRATGESGGADGDRHVRRRGSTTSSRSHRRRLDGLSPTLDGLS
jgi:hypothetical protein